MPQSQTLLSTNTEESIPPEPYDKKHVDMQIFDLLKKNFDLGKILSCF